MTKILGLSSFYHDAAAALVIDGEVIAAAQEERFTRKKHDPSFPEKAIEYVLREGKISVHELDYVAFYDKPMLKFERILESILDGVPGGLPVWMQAIPSWLDHKLMVRSTIRKRLEHLKDSVEFIFPEHHESHAAGAFFPSPWKEAAFLSIDGVGEWATTSWGVGKENNIEIRQEIHFPHSLGMLYSAFTAYTGFKVNSGEYKVMGLAPYGEPEYVNTILEHLIDLKEDGSFHLNMDYFNYTSGLRTTSEKFHKLFGGPPRVSESQLTQREMNLARSIQEVIDIAMLKLGKHIHSVTGLEHLAMSGGVTLNCVANGKLLREGPFKDLWIQPAAGDAGSALGAALFTWYQYLGNERPMEKAKNLQKGSYLGSSYSSSEIKKYLDENQIPYTEYKDPIEASKKAARHIADQAVIGYFQGRMEFGPRALGARSIIGDARSTEMQSVMNLKIKFRESFRPFAPSVLKEHVSEYFEHQGDSDYMLIVAPVKENIRIPMTEEQEKLFGIDKLNVPRSKLPAITHVDYSARIQTVDGVHNRPYYELIKEFHRITGTPVIINTSFNVRGEPIVESPEQAYKCFMRTHMDYLVLENFILDKKDQPEMEGDTDWQQEFELD